VPDSVRNSGAVGQTSRQAASAQCLHKSGAIRGPGHLRRRRWRGPWWRSTGAPAWAGSRTSPRPSSASRIRAGAADGRARSSCATTTSPPDEQRDHHRSGWSLYLERLALCVAGGDPGPDPNTW